MEYVIFVVVVILCIINLAMANIIVRLSEKFDTVIERQDNLDRKQRNLDL